VSELECQSRVQLLFRQRAVMDSLAVGTHLLCLTAVTPGKPVRVTAALTINLRRQNIGEENWQFFRVFGCFYEDMSTNYRELVRAHTSTTAEQS